LPYSKDGDSAQFSLDLAKRRMSVPNLRHFSVPSKSQTQKPTLFKPERNDKSQEIEKENLSCPIPKSINPNISQFSQSQDAPLLLESAPSLESKNQPEHLFNEKCHNSLLPESSSLMEEEVIIAQNDESRNIPFSSNIFKQEQQNKIEVSTQNDVIEQHDSVTQTENIENSERIPIEMCDMQVNTELTLNQLGDSKPEPKIDLCDQEVQVNDNLLEEENKTLQRQLGICHQQLESQSKQISELQDLLRIKEDELSQVRGQITTLKLSFLGQLSSLREQLAHVKNEQSNTKQDIDWSLKKTIEFLITFVSSKLSSYINERNNKHKEDLLSTKLQVSNLKDELQKLKDFIILAIGRLKQGLAQQCEGDIKGQVQKMVDESSKGKLWLIGDIFNENISVTTDSSAPTPRKDGAPKKTPKKRIDPVILEGMKYLLDHEGLKNPFEQNPEYKDKLDEMIKSPHPVGLDSSLVLSTLMDRSTRRSATKSPAHSESAQTNSSSHKKTPAKRNNHTDLKDSTTKKVKRELKHYTSFLDDNGDKFLVVDDQNQNQNQH